MDEERRREERRPVEEAGGGEAEGFEDAERELEEHASHGEHGHSPELDAFPPEEAGDTAEHGEADEVVRDPDEPGR